MTSKNNQSDALMLAAVEILRQAENRRLGTTVLNKCLFYLDLFWLLESGETATRSTFLALEQGPVVAKYPKRLVKELEHRGLATQREVGDWKPVSLSEKADEMPEAPFRHLVPEVIALVGRLRAGEASDYSHENPGWKAAWKEGGEYQPKPIDMITAMLQVADEDPWLDDDLTNAERKSFGRADSATGVDWWQ